MSAPQSVATPPLRAQPRPDPKPFPHAADLLGTSSESHASSSSSSSMAMEIDRTPPSQRLLSIRDRLDRESARLRERMGENDHLASIDRDVMLGGWNELGYPQPYSPPSAFRPHHSPDDVHESILRAAGPAMLGSLPWDPPVATDRPSPPSIPIDSFASSTARLRARAREQVPISDLRERRRDSSAPDFDPSDISVPPPRPSQRNFRDRLARLDALRVQGERLTPADTWVGRPSWIGRSADDSLFEDMTITPTPYPLPLPRPTANLPTRAREDRSHLFGEIPIDTVHTRVRTTDPLSLTYRPLPNPYIPINQSHPFHRRATPAGGEFDYYHLNHHYLPQRSPMDSYEIFSQRAARLAAMGLDGMGCSLELRDNMEEEERRAVIEMVVRGVPKLPPPTRKKAAESMLETSPWAKVDLEVKDEYCSVCHDEVSPRDISS